MARSSRSTPRPGRESSHWLSYVSVEDVDAAAKAATANGGKLVEAPADLPEVGRMARIADPQGAEICLFKSATGDPPDAPLAAESDPVPLAMRNRWLWNELQRLGNMNCTAEAARPAVGG